MISFSRFISRLGGRRLLLSILLCFFVTFTRSLFLIARLLCRRYDAFALLVSLRLSLGRLCSLNGFLLVG